MVPGPGRPARPWARLAMSALAGALLWLALPPAGVWPAGVAGVALCCWVSADTWTERLALGATTAVVLFAGSLRWLWPFTGIGTVLLIGLQSLILAAASSVSPAWRGRLVAMPGALVLSEAVRHRWPLSGLPLSGIELGQVDGPLAPVAAHLGALGVVLAAGVGASLLVTVARGRGRSRAAGTVAVVGLLAVVVALPYAPGTVRIGTVDTAIVQGGGPRGTTAVGAADPAAPFRRHLATTRTIPPDRPDLVVWPEDIVDVTTTFADAPERTDLADLADDLDATLLVGIVEDADTTTGPVRRFRNAAVALAPDGRIVDRYDKQLLVPFGEYVPARPLVDRIADLSLIPREAVPGTTPPVLQTPVGPLGTVISFEGLFPRRVRAAVRAGGEIVVVPTNSSSYATADAPAQQVAAARLRALESGRDVVLAAPTGYSAHIGPDGTVLDRSGLGTSAVLEAEVTRRRGLTPYTRYGDTPVVLLAALLLSAGWWRSRSGHRPPRAGGGSTVGR